MSSNITKHRIQGFLLRHWYEITATIDRKADMFFWPTIDLLSFGLLTVHINNLNISEGLAASIIGGLIMWTLVYSIQRDITLALLEDTWSRNLYNLYSSPLTVQEIVIGSLLLSMMKALVTISVITFLATKLFAFNLWSFGPSIFYLLFNIFVFGWAFGYFTSSFVLRFGTKVQILAWSLIATLYPLSGVFYPLETLPVPLAHIAKLFPVGHIFEALRGIILKGTTPSFETILIILGLNALYISAGVFLFVKGFKHAKGRGWFIHPS